MKRFWIPALLSALAACSQAPADLAAPALEAQFGTAAYDEVTGLAGHGSGANARVYALGGTGGDLHGPSQGRSDAFTRVYRPDGVRLAGTQFGTPKGDYVTGVAADAGGHQYVVTDAHNSGSAGFDPDAWNAYLYRYTDKGVLVWRRKIEIGVEEHVRGVAVSNGSVYVVGLYNSELPEEANGNAFVRKYTTDGLPVWTRLFGTKNGVEGATDVVTDARGAVYVVGRNGPFAHTAWDTFVRKYTPGGSLEWEKQLHYSYDDSAQAVVAFANDVYVVGNFPYLDQVFEDTDIDVRVVKLSGSGAVIWSRNYGPVGNDVVVDADIDDDGNLYLAGRTQGTFAGLQAGGGDGFVVKLSSGGARLWSRPIATAQRDTADAVEVVSGSVYVGGSSEGPLVGPNAGGADGYVMRLDAKTGSVLWTR